MPTAQLSSAAKEALFGLVARLADNKYFLGRYYAEWCSGAPTLESAVAAAAMAQDELGHARALYPLLRQLATEPGPELEPETRTRFTRLACLDQSFAGWEDFIAANFLVDGALTTIFAAAIASSYEPLAGRSRKALQEEQLHAQHGEAWVRRLAGEGGAVRVALEAALRRIWDEVLCWYGPPATQGEGPLSAEGVLDATPDELRARFLAIVGPTIEACGLSLPLRRRTRGAEDWESTAPLPWDRWDSASYRLTNPAIDPSAVSAATAGKAPEAGT